MTERVLFVDDDANILNALKRGLRKRVTMVTAQGGQAGLEALQNDGPFAVIISDQQMPEMDGVTFLAEAEKMAPLSVRMMLTGNADQNTAIQAVNEGHIFRFLNKPCALDYLESAIKSAQKQFDLVTAERDLLEQTLAGSVKVLVDVLGLRDPKSFKTTSKLRRWAKQLGPLLDMDARWTLDMAIMLSPLGRIVLPSDVRKKLDESLPLTSAEEELVEDTPQVARNLISNIPRMAEVAQGVYYQAKGFDGSGFPADHVMGSSIPLSARLLRILSDLAAVCKMEKPGLADLKKLEAQAELYDPALIDGLAKTLCAPGEDEALFEKKAVSVGGLEEGDRLTHDIVTEGGTMILSAEHELSDPMIHKIRQLSRVRKIEEPITILRQK